MIRLTQPPAATAQPGPGWAPALLARLGSMTAFGLVGLSGIGVNQLLLWALVDLTAANYLVAAVVASACSTTTNFLLNDILVFRARSGAGQAARYLGFMALTLATLPIRLPILYVLTTGLHVHYLASNLVALVATFAARYAFSDGLIWGRRENRGSVFPPTPTLPSGARESGLEGDG
jgi:dolichol-phosphate mannosyltransferase